MCGRFSNAQELSELAALVEFVVVAGFMAPRFNIAPRQFVPVLRREEGRTVLRPLRWGLIPSWAEEERIGDNLINARAETLAEKASFRKPFARQRCLVPADGFYEWRRAERSRTPFRFTLAGGGLFCFAGLWERWLRPPRAPDLIPDDPGQGTEGAVVETFTIITTEANALVRPVHERMPVILPAEHYRSWLDEQQEADFLQPLLRPFPAEEMVCVQVSDKVNSARFDGPECFQPAPT